MKNPDFHLKEILKKALPEYCSGRVVDVGSGHAKYRHLIKAFSTSYTTVDNLSSDDQFRGSDFKPDVISSVDAMPFQDEEFTTVICTEVLEHVEDPFKVVGEVARILKPGGYAIISSGWMAPYHKEPDDYWRFSVAGYKVLCSKNNLEFVRFYKKGGFFTVILYFINRNIVLNSSNSLFKKVTTKSSKPLELLAELLDRLIKTEDTVGHVIVARKQKGIESPIHHD